MLGSAHLSFNPVLDQQKLDKMDPMQNQLCRVCGEPAAGFHFGAFTCEGCKSFFGRTCNNQSVIQECKNNYRCVVDKKNRTACKACRLRKCLMVGMSKSGSRYGRRSNWFKIHCLMQQNTHPSGQEPPSLLSTSSSCSLTPKKEMDFNINGNSRSPSPLNTSSDSSSKKSSIASPLKMEPIKTTSPIKQAAPPRIKSPDTLLAPQLPDASPLASLYSGAAAAFPSPLSLMSNGAFPFYKLSPLLAAHNPLLANPFLASLGHKPALDLFQEHRELLARFGGSLPSPAGLRPTPSPPHIPVSPPRRSPGVCHDDDDDGDEAGDRSAADAPIDLSVKISAGPVTSLLMQQAGRRPSSASPPVHSPGGHTAQDDEGIEVDLDKSDKNRNHLVVHTAAAPGFEERRDALDLTVSS